MKYTTDWASVEKSNIVGEFKNISQPKTNADEEFNINFKQEILKEQQDLSVSLRIYNKDYRQFSQSNDYSFLNGVIVYYDGNIIQGEYPKDNTTVN